MFQQAAPVPHNVQQSFWVLAIKEVLHTQLSAHGSVLVGIQGDPAAV
jgi:hypothetical protein